MITSARPKKRAGVYRNGNGKRRSLRVQIARSAKTASGATEPAIDLIAESGVRKAAGLTGVFLSTEKERTARNRLAIRAKIAMHVNQNFMDGMRARIVGHREVSRSGLGTKSPELARNRVRKTLPQAVGETKGSAQTRAALSAIRGAANPAIVPDTLSGSFHDVRE